MSETQSQDELLPPADEYLIDFNTKIDPPNIQAVRVRLDIVTVRDMQQTFRIDLRDHPLYEELAWYVRHNPPVKRTEE